MTEASAFFVQAVPAKRCKREALWLEQLPEVQDGMESKHASFHAVKPDRFHKFVGLFPLAEPMQQELEKKEFRGQGKMVVYPSAASLVAWTQPDG